MATLVQEVKADELVKRLEEPIGRLMAMVRDVQEQLTRIEKQLKDTDLRGFADRSRR